MKNQEFGRVPVYRNIMWQVGGSVINRASFFVALLLLSGYMLKNDYGGFSLSYNYALSISSILSTGLGITARRELVKESIRRDQFSILISNIIIISLICLLICTFITIYIRTNNTITINTVCYFFLLFFLSFNASLSYYLNFHYAGLSLFREYNILLLPINIILPIIFIIIKPDRILLAGLCMAIVLFLGNVIQVLYLREKIRINFAFHKENYRYYIPCFLQALLGLPILTIFQTIIVSRWNNIAFIGLIALMQQILNMSNIFASKSLTVFSPRITVLKNKYQRVPSKQLIWMFFSYVTIIILITAVVYIILPIILQIVNSNYQDSLVDMRYFLLMNIIISSTWFIPEYYHAIRKSWVSFSLNAVFSISVFIIFYSLFYTQSEFNLRDYANCLTLSRIIFVVPILYSLCIRLKKLFLKSVYP